MNRDTRLPFPKFEGFFEQLDENKFRLELFPEDHEAATRYLIDVTHDDTGQILTVQAGPEKLTILTGMPTKTSENQSRDTIRCEVVICAQNTQCEDVILLGRIKLPIHKIGPWAADRVNEYFSSRSVKLPHMWNARMHEGLKNGKIIDLSSCEKNPEGDYILDYFDKDRDIDYCDANKEAWIWSIGKNLKTGQILASTGGKFYQNEEYECLFLR